MSENKAIKAISASSISPHNEALYEAGKSLLINSISTGRDFCKFMISLCVGGIPIYLGLLKFVLPINYTFDLSKDYLFIAPPIVFLIGAIIFTIAYFPQTDSFSLDIIEEINEAIKKTINKRRQLTTIGFALFIVGNILGIYVIITI